MAEKVWVLLLNFIGWFQTSSAQSFYPIILYVFRFISIVLSDPSLSGIIYVLNKLRNALVIKQAQLNAIFIVFGRFSVLQVSHNNGFIITWILHQIFMFSYKVKLVAG